VPTDKITVHLSPDEITLLIEALDSHEYWQVSEWNEWNERNERNERNDGYSTIDDGVNAEVDAVRALIAKLGIAGPS
jgi:hypothetical protein